MTVGIIPTKVLKKKERMKPESKMYQNNLNTGNLKEY